MSGLPKSSRWGSTQIQGVVAALLSGVVLGLPPVFGKQAILEGTAPLTVVMLRTTLAIVVLWTAYAVFWRKYIFIYPVGLIGCLVAGVLNGLGSLFFYAALGRLDASLVQLIFMLNTIFLTLVSRLDGYPITRFTVFRLGLALGAVYLLTGAGAVQADWLGVLMALVAGAMYALHVVVNQHVLYDMPSPTVAVYTLTAMALTVSIAYLIGGRPPLPASAPAWRFVILLTVVTVISRLALFMGVKYLGGVQAALLGLSEALVTVIIAQIVLGEQLNAPQWLGTALLATSILLVAREKALGYIPEPKPWFQLLAAWAARQRLPAPPPPASPAVSRSSEPGD